jgi:hypothetical protein
MRPKNTRTPPPPGCRVRHCAGSTSRLRGAPRTMSNRAPSGSATRSAFPATKQAAGVPSAWSQPSQSTHERPRRWCDAGPLGRKSVTADQKAGDEGRVRDSDRIQRPVQHQRHRSLRAGRPHHNGQGQKIDRSRANCGARFSAASESEKKGGGSSRCRPELMMLID